MKRNQITIKPGDRAAFNNNAAYCVGTGRMGLALQREYMDQLTKVQALCRFKHIRGHGLFCDDMAIYQTRKAEDGTEQVWYNFAYLDRVMDDYIARGLVPFIELGFMPGQIASGTQTIFYWKGNTTPPADEGKWCDLIQATLRHLMARYGADEVVTWPVEVWNEPNLPGFWEHADKQKYLRLYEISATAVKAVDARFCVGGPAVCGGDGSQGWISDFLTFCRDKALPVDFVTRHAYMGNTPEHRGRYLYHTMREVEDVFGEMAETRRVIDSFPEYRGMPMHITEFNTSYNPFCPIHDTNLNAAYIAGLLACLGDVAASYSYWTFGDVFEEGGVPATPFHGGFGMMANQMIAKPTLYTFEFFNNLTGTCVYRDASTVVMQRPDGSYEGIVWNLCRDTRDLLHTMIELPGEGRWTLMTRTVDEQCCNPLALWHQMGEPASLNAEQLAFLREAAHPVNAASVVEAADGRLPVNLMLNENALVHFTLAPSQLTPDYGYDYDWYTTHA